MPIAFRCIALGLLVPVLGTRMDSWRINIRRSFRHGEWKTIVYNQSMYSECTPERQMSFLLVIDSHIFSDSFPDSHSAPQACKLAVVARRDLQMSAGKLAAQVRGGFVIKYG